METASRKSAGAIRKGDGAGRKTGLMAVARSKSAAGAVRKGDRASKKSVSAVTSTVTSSNFEHLPL